LQDPNQLEGFLVVEHGIALGKPYADVILRHSSSEKMKGIIFEIGVAFNAPFLNIYYLV